MMVAIGLNRGEQSLLALLNSELAVEACLETAKELKCFVQMDGRHILAGGSEGLLVLEVGRESPKVTVLREVKATHAGGMLC